MSAAESAATAAVRREQRLRRVLEYIEARLDEPLDAATLAGVAAFSRFHFHRQFAARVGCTVRDYLAQARLRSAAWRLAYRPRQSIAQIALACGYGSPEAFARAFKAAIGQTPSAFRRLLDWPMWQAREDALRHIRSTHMPNPPVPSAARIVDFPATRIALLVHRGDPQRLGESIRRFIAWRRSRHLPPSAAATYNLLYDDPAAVPANQFRLGLAVATTREIAAADDGLVAAWIPAGRCAIPVTTIGSATHCAGCMQTGCRTAARHCAITRRSCSAWRHSPTWRPAPPSPTSSCRCADDAGIDRRQWAGLCAAYSTSSTRRSRRSRWPC